jgi:lysozyme
MKIGQRGLDLIKEFEGCKLKAYQCPAGVWTIGIGSTHYGDGTPVTKNRTLPNEGAALALLAATIGQYEKDVTSLVKVPINQNQFDALVSFAYNLGSDIDKDDIAEGLGDSTLLKKLNAGDYTGAANEFKKWNKSSGKSLAGLTRRREAESELFLS